MNSPIPGDDYNLILCLIVTIVLQLSFYGIAYSLQTDRFTDLAGASNFALLAFLSFFLGSFYHPRQIIVFSFILLWSFRLGAFLFYRVLQRGHDERFNEMRKNPVAFLGFWIFQIIWVFTVSLPAIFLNAIEENPQLGGTDGLGIALFAIGFLIELFADWQRLLFNQQKSSSRADSPVSYGSSGSSDISSSSPFLHSGLWKFSRHPNYFGEIVLWIGIFLLCCRPFQEGHDYAYFSLFSPVLVIFLLLFVSGLPLAEQKNERIYGKMPEYREYARKTAPLIVFPTSWYAALPYSFKRIFCLENSPEAPAAV